jgi:2-oxo-3-hexenedioate decarboxylase
VGVLERDSFNPRITAGEIVTTGTLTRAMPIRAGERWATRLADVPLDGADIRFG